jgi:hypothetical protein
MVDPMTIPRTADDLTPAWLGAALGKPVEHVDIEPVGVGVGLVGTLFRCSFNGERVIAKLAAPTDEGRFVATVLNMYGREVGFYTELSARTPIAHPRCFYAEHDPVTQDTVLLLEDVSTRGTAIDQIAGCTRADSGPALRTLARLHAEFWDDPTLADLPWLLHLGDEPYPSSVAFAYETAWPRVQEFFTAEITPAVKKFGDTYSARIPALFAKLSEGPVVLSHADWRLDNLFFTPDGEVLAIDWQLIDRSVGMRDLAYYVTENMDIGDPKEYREVFDEYIAELRALGVAVDEAWAWEMYRYATVLGFVYPVIAAGALSIEDPRHIELTRAMLVRCIDALDALDAFELPL